MSSAAAAAGNKKVTLAAWKKNKRHTITLQSSPDIQVEIEVPNLPELIASGEFPNKLIDAAIAVASGKTVSAEDIKEQAEFYRHLVAKTVKEPVLTPEDVAELPFEDVELLVSIATRSRELDGVGNHISGLDKSDDWLKFRGLID